ncbi:MAG: BlaI/MecI/CopY family transcriptional regulator [Verrucomicrobiales bacterium]|nr:BlaI/MecI/CopY family transcriptional regulator [Verrucomicrobiales bacterium]
MKKEERAHGKFSRREGEVMDVLFQKETATARDVWSALGENRTYSTIRKILSILEEKGHITHRTEGGTFIYSPKEKREAAASSAMGRLVDTFFGGSVEGAVSSLLGNANRKLSKEELERIGKMIDEAKQQTRKGKKGES